MTEDENKVTEPMKALAHDLGLNPDRLTNLDLDSVFKKSIPVRYFSCVRRKK